MIRVYRKRLGRVENDEKVRIQWISYIIICLTLDTVYVYRFNARFLVNDVTSKMLLERVYILHFYLCYQNEDYVRKIAIIIIVY